MNDHGEKNADAVRIAVLAVTLVAGVAWLVVFYVSKGLYPVSSLRYWNLAIGFGAIVAAVSMLAKRR